MPRKPPRRAAKPEDGGLPSREQILEFLAGYVGKAGKREIARAFGVSGGARIALKRLLAEMAADGTLSGNRKALKERGTLPPTAVLEIIGRDPDGDMVGQPTEWDRGDGDRPHVLVTGALRRGTAEEPPGIGDRIIARILRTRPDEHAGYALKGEFVKRLPRERRRLIGIFRAHPRGGGTIEPVSKKELRAWTVLKGDEGDARAGDLVAFEPEKRGRVPSTHARITENLGNPEAQQKISLIAIHAHGLPDGFPDVVSAEAESLAPAGLEGRTDLRRLPLVTIDPVDARDHDDAVFAEPDEDPKNAGGWRVTVAIADVAHYVRPGTRLDREARLRGNSVYFPDRVVPMLPERISNDLCSLREKEDRACLAVEMVFDASGHKRRHTFRRALMRSAAKLSYQEAQAAIDGAASDKCGPLLEPVLKPLWAAYAALAKARDHRAPLDLDLPERKIVLDAEGRVARVVIPERLTAHRLIEEFMIQANVAAAETLEARNQDLIYRIHDQPSKEKIKNLKDFLETLDIKAPLTGALKAGVFNKVLAEAKRLPVPDLVNEVVLRSQAQAEYSPDNIGHFGLNLLKYAHFTSPIRRYADLVVHRALVRALELGAGGLADEELPKLAETARLISEAERRAMAAERETVDRLIAAHLSEKVGALFEARISGVTRSGLFVRLDDTGADGFIPVSTLGAEFFHHDEAAHALTGTRTGETYQLGDRASVRLVEVVPAAGAMRFEMISEGKSAAGPSLSGFRGRGLPRNRRRGRR